jgi:hypothetical protein
VVRLTGGWVDVDPSNWRNRADTEVKVGIGTGTPEERISAGLSILELQKMALPFGMTDSTKIYKTLNNICVAMGNPSAEPYFHNPNTPQGRQALQQAEQQKQQQREKSEQMLAMGLALDAEDKHKNRMIQMGELQRKIEADADDFTLKATELELEYDEDVEGSAV